MRRSLTIIFTLTLLAIVFILQGQRPQQAKADKRFTDGEEAYMQGKFVKGNSGFERAMKLYENDDEQYISAASMAALALLNRGKVKEAFYVFKDAEERYEANKDNISLETAARLKLCLSKYHLAYQESDYAMPLLKETEDIVAAIPHKIPPYLQIETNQTIGEVYYSQGNHKRALGYFEKAIDMAEKQPKGRVNYKLLAKTKVQAGELHGLLLNPENAISQLRDLFEHDQAMMDSLISENPKQLANLYSKMAEANFEYTDYDSSQHYLQKALTFPMEPKKKAETEFMLSTVKLYQKEYSQALNFNGNAIKFWSDPKNENPEMLYTALMQFGKIVQEIDTADMVAQWYGELAVGGHNSPGSELSDYKQFPVSYFRDPERSINYNMALVCYERAQKLVEKLPLKERFVALVEIHMAKGALFFQTRHYLRSKGEYQNAYKLMPEVYIDKHPLRAEALRALSELVLIEGKVDSAMMYVNLSLNESLKEGKEFTDRLEVPAGTVINLEYPYEFLFSIGIKGQVLRHQYLRDKEESTLEGSYEAFEITTKLMHYLRSVHRNEGAKYPLSELSQKFSQQAILTCDQLYKLSNKERYIYDAFNHAEASKSSMLLETVHDLKAKRVAGVPDSLIKRENKLKTAMAYLEGEIYFEVRKGKHKDTSKVKALNKRLDIAKEEYNGILKEVEKDFKSYHDLKFNFSTSSVLDLQEQLKSDETVLNFMLLDTLVCVFVIDQQSISYNIFETPEKQSVPSAIQEFVMAIMQNQFQAFSEYGKTLYDYTIGHVRNKIKTSKLIIIPDLELNYIPFELLQSSSVSDFSSERWESDYLHYLVEEFSICYNYSASLFVEGRRFKLKEGLKNFVAWAPDFTLLDSLMAQSNEVRNRYKSLHLTPLPYATQEVAELGALCKGDVHTGYTTESEFKKTATNYGVLHLATHGILNNRNPMYSKLAMLSDDKEDGLLHTYELYNMQLNAEMVTLSACNSGVGKIRKGEGAMSIARGFAYAGCPNIIMSLWPVSDQATKIVMDKFYGYLLQGTPKDEALQKAKLDYLASYKGANAAPILWGAFVIVGNPDPVKSLTIAQGMAWWVWTIIGLGSLLLLFILQKLFRKQPASSNIT